jgi:hypothetical protein
MAEEKTEGYKWPWWTIHGESLMEALKRAHAGEDPDLVYAELYANSDVINYEAKEDD